MLVDPSSGEPTRVGMKRDDGKRVRIAKKSGKEIE
jgi:large subunit ribosomal protein L24